MMKIENLPLYAIFTERNYARRGCGFDGGVYVMWWAIDKHSDDRQKLNFHLNSI